MRPHTPTIFTPTRAQPLAAARAESHSDGAGRNSVRLNPPLRLPRDGLPPRRGVFLLVRAQPPEPTTGCEIGPVSGSPVGGVTGVSLAGVGVGAGREPVAGALAVRVPPSGYATR